MEKLILGIIAILGLMIIERRFSSFRKGEPAADELSSLLLQKSSSLSFYISLYYWLLIGYLGDKVALEPEQLISHGIVGMVVIFAGSCSFLKLKGLSND